MVSMSRELNVKILIVSNMYPSKDKPFWGTFVKNCHDGYVSQGVSTDLAVITDSGIKGYLVFYWLVFFKLVFGKHDIAHVHYVTHSVLPVLLARIFRKFRIVLNFHGSDAFPEDHEGKARTWLKQRINRIALRYSALVLVPSHYFYKKMQQAYAVNNMFVTPSGGVDAAIFPYVFTSQKKVLFAGRFLPEKGGVVAARAIHACRARVEGATIIGDGSDKTNIINALAGYQVRMPGLLPQKALAAEMASHLIFLFPSSREGESLGLVVVEAIFSGMVPLVLDNGAVREVIPAHLQELLVAGHKKEFPQKLSHLLSMPMSELEQISQELFRHSLDHYSSVEVAKSLVKALEDLK